MITAKAHDEAATDRWKPIAVFLMLAYVIGWVLWLPAVLGPAGPHITQYDAYLPFFVSLGTIGPLIASFVAVRYESGRWGMPSRLLPPAQLRRWLCLLIGPVLVVIAFVNIPYVICMAPGHRLIPLRFLAPLLAVWPNILGGPLEEEFGWRGYLLPRLCRRMGNTWATVCVGIIWASWHLPLMLSHVWGVSFWYFLSMVVAVAVFASVGYFATGGSILGAIVVHYVFNSCSSMLNTVFEGQQPYRDLSETVLVSMVCVALLTIAATRGRLGQQG